MAQLTLRDLATNEEIVVPPEGFVFGRVGGDADIQIEDNSISRRQARVSQRAGQWLLEVMVVPPGQRLPRPQALQEGQTFLIGQSEFEVVVVEADEEEPEPPTRNAAPRAAKGGAAPRRAPPTTPEPSVAPRKNAASRPPPPASRGTEQEEAVEEAPAKGGIVALFAGVPKGIAYYVVNVPKMLFNPLGTVRSTIEELPSPAMGMTGLIGHALPALFIQQLLPAWAGAIVGLVNGGGFDFLAFLPVVPAVSAAVGAVVVGLIYHPVTRFIIDRLLKGQSDERSRTNYFLQTMTVAVLLSVPATVAVLLGLVPVPFIWVLGVLLTAAAGLITTFVNFKWLKFFKVMSWVPTVVLVLGILGALGSVASGVTASLAMSAASSVTADAEAQVRAAQELADRMNADAQKRLEEASAAAAGAGDRAEVVRAAAVVRGAPGGEGTPPPAAPKPPPEPESPPVRDSPPVAEPRAAAEVERPEEPATGGTGYPDFVRKRAAVEKRLADDPTLVAAGKGARLYGDYSEAVRKVEARFEKELSRHEGKKYLYLHQQNAALYRETARELNAVAEFLGIP